MRWALSRDGGQTFEEPRIVDDGSPIGRADVAFLDDGSVVVLWMAHAGDNAEVLARRYTSSGEADAPLVVTELDASRSSGFPRMASLGDRALVVWTDPDGPRLGAALLVLSK